MKLLAGLALTLVVLGAASLAFAAGESWRLRMDRVGPIRAGMTSDQVQHLLGERVAEDMISPSEECWHLRGRNGLDGVSFMIIYGKVARIEVDSSKFVALSGAHIGSTEGDLKRLYGPKLLIEPHKYLDDDGNYLTRRSENGRFGIRFETEKGRVFRFYAGPWEHLRYVEGCA